MAHLLRLLTFCSVVLFAGCLGSSYSISHDELTRIARLDPSTRGQRVRATQNLGVSDPEHEPETVTVVEAPAPVVVAPVAPAPVYVEDAVIVDSTVVVVDTSSNTAPRRPGPSVVDVVTDGEETSESPRSNFVVQAAAGNPGSSPSVVQTVGGTASAPSPTVAQTVGVNAPTPAATPQAAVEVRQNTSQNESSSSSSSESSSDSDGDDDAMGILVVVAVVAAAVVAGLIAIDTESRRFDGYVSLPSNQPLILHQQGQNDLVVPLASLTPDLAERSDDADFFPSGDVHFLDAAPFDRQGFSYAVELGFSELAFDTGAFEGGVHVRQSIGYFPIHQIGLLANVGAGQAEGNESFELRLGLEARVLPVELGPMSLGVYGNVGQSYLLGSPSPVDAHNRVYYGGGLLTEFGLATRIGLLLRLGVNNTASDLGSSLGLEGSVGITVY